LLLMHDGWQWRALSALAPILDELSATGAVPPMVVVMQECPPWQRGSALTRLTRH
jgi:enterochelin esterase-like enzyme